MRVTIGSRRSELARIQAFQVGEALRSAHPQIEVDYSFRESLGDKNQNDPLWQMPEKGVFTQDFRQGLLQGEFDLVVHSWKDLAIETDPETRIAATLPRADPRDLLLVRKDRWPQVERTGIMSILTSSPRRAYNLESFFREVLPAKLHELNFLNVRGNVPTRIRKLFQSEVDGLIVAKVAIDRLLQAPQNEFAATQTELRNSLSHCRFAVLPLRANPSAPAQGALAIEISKQRVDLADLLAPIHCPATFAVVAREREILASYGGGCHQKIGVSVLARPFGEVTFLRGLTDDGQALNGCSLQPSKARPPKAPRAQMWPQNPSESDWFQREKTRARIPDNSISLWIAKAEAIPDDQVIDPNQIVWASGIQTWKRLARRGVWVNGSAESLGEQEEPKIETLIGAKLDWLKLTHEQGYTEGSMPNLATYRLRPKNVRMAFEGKKYFFWNSGSSFEYAAAQNPWLKEMTHFCGPGNTRQILKRNGVEPHVFLDHAQWLAEMSES
jgi:hydroxymethylbilane synthase